MNNSEPISIPRALRGKNIILTGASGFLGKVWLCMALTQFRELGKIYVLLRKKKGSSAKARLEEIINSSPAFSGLHREFSGELEEFLAERLAVIEGDVEQENFGISPRNLEKLRGRVDLIVHCAGLVDFQPDLRASFRSNVLGALHALTLVQRLGGALLHVSTAFVAGSRDGEVPETVTPDTSPSGRAFDPEREFAELQTLVAAPLPAGKTWAQIGKARAASWGWPNAYAYTKALAEALIVRRAGRSNYSLFRPTIIESALAFPFPGWNEGMTTCAPLSYLLSDWTRIVPANPQHRIDLIPVDKVCEAMSLIAAALLAGKAERVYHCGTSQHNPITVRFLVELMGLSHRRHLKDHGKTFFERNWLSRVGNAISERDGIFSPENLRTLTTILLDLADFGAKFVPDGGKVPLEKGRKILQKMKWDLLKAERVVDTFKPYLKDYNYRFVSANLKRIPVAEAAFRFTPEAIPWSEYIVNIHEPGLRKWCYPLMQGKPAEKFHPARPCPVDGMESLD